MKKPFVSFLLLAILSLSLKAGTPSNISVPSGTVITLELPQTVSTKGQDYSEGQSIPFMVAADVIIDGKVVVRGGSIAEGVITGYKKQRGLGVAGHIRIVALNVRAVDGSTLFLSKNEIPNDGRSRRGLALGLGLGLGVGLGYFGGLPLLACMAIKGKPAIIESGSIFDVSTQANVSVKVE